MLIAQTVLAVLLVAITVIPFLPIAHGFVRMGEFPRQQILIVALACLVLSLASGGLLFDRWFFVVTFSAIALFQAWFIAEFTRLWRKESKHFDPAVDHGQRFRLVASNVKMSNRDYAAHIRMIEQADPDILLLMEVDDDWLDGLASVLDRFPHRVDRAQENSYGMAMMSKFRLDDVSVQDLLTEGVPSIFATVVLDKTLRFRLYSIHPEPPVPHRGTEGRDGETALISLKIRDERGPVIVTGDLNDVAWSKTTRRFRRISRLLDPRIGRRMINSFDARYWFMRWPLDHLFHSAHFRLVDMQRLEPGGSDHFPVQFDLVLCHDPEASSGPDEAADSDIDRARTLVQEADERDDEPIGTDWEK
ncbi:endonuclease/exonuclease/phosphatase family protein [Tianweitania sp. BSSL-BM11]|uniref:Endonuclease/exonuclease/phosphatase family protein n=1 Tax=Tianweitania aestuarii TaxID=2814886 RepID=A0ABS5RTV3_9HYPH|nr:endonuclease/exonuclease/phosphatase family protein [Tianweitania aestuarii]MBS9719157.1 endonuclease/exonuclease/phosphatase family protein [Tianweitania aestuarii]